MADLQDNKSGVHVLTKSIGETPLQCILRYKKEHPELAQVPMTYAGRLDPMAEGLLLVLSGETIREKEKYLGLSKTYECEILWGISTDTIDLLGLITAHTSVVPTETSVRDTLSHTGEFDQKYPAYSSQPVNGKPLFQWSREGRLSEVEIPYHKVELSGAALISRKEISSKDLHNHIISKIQLVSGDFRQEEIVSKWEEFFVLSEIIFFVDKISLHVSSGFYVRQFISDVALRLGAEALAFSIKRTRIGDFHL